MASTWEAKGDYTIRYFIEPIEPVVLAINYALKLGYKPEQDLHDGEERQGAGAGAVDQHHRPQQSTWVKVSFPLAGSVPLDIKVGQWRKGPFARFDWFLPWLR